MNKFSTYLLLLLVGLGFNTAFGQDSTPLYAGQRDGGTGDVLTTIDTAGGVWTVTGTTTLTSDAGSVQGTYGLSMDPTTEIMYILYESDAGAQDRRLGTLDPMTGSITDIGVAGNENDMAFDATGTLYSTGGNWDGNYDIHELDLVTGAPSFAYNLPSGTWGMTIDYDPFNDQFVKQNSNGFSTFDPVGGTESPVGGLTSECHAMIVLDENTASFMNYSSRYEINTTTGVATFIEGMGFNYQAFGFGQVPCDPIEIVTSPTEVCEGVEVTLTGTSMTGGTITWDMGVDNGVAFVPGVPGTYLYTPTSDSEDDCPANPVEVTVVGLPTVVAGAGDLVFCEDEMITLSTAGDAHFYEWNDGEELDLMPGVGTYTFTLFGEYLTGGCLGENTDEVTVEVVALPTITASASSDPICLGLNTTFTGGGGDSYWWDSGVEDGVAFTPGEIGTATYTVIGTDENGCMNTASVDVEVVEGITITGTTVIETVGGDGEIDIDVTGGAPAYDFDWDNDGLGEWGDDEDLTGLDEGIYTVHVLGSAGCEMEATFVVDSQLGIEDLNAAGISVYPNPTSDLINVVFAGTFQYELVAINGDVLVAGTATDKEEINLSAFADGVYFVNITSENTATAVKVVKK